MDTGQIIKIFFGYIAKWFIILGLISIFLQLFGDYFDFMIYHINFMIFYIWQTFLEPTTLRLYVLTAIILPILWLLKKITSIFL